MGRKRRQGAREPNGRASRKEHRGRDFAPTKIRRAIDDALAGYGNALYGSMLGQLALREKIEPYHVAAGQRYAGLTVRYHAATGAPPFSHGNPEGGLGGGEPDVDSPLGRELSLSERAVIERMHKVEDILMRLGRPTVVAVRDVCELDIDPGPWRYSDLRNGLHAVAGIFNLTPNGKNVR